MVRLERGRETIAPLIGKVMERARSEGTLAYDTPADAVGLYLNLLVGDLQIRRAIGREPPMVETATSRCAGQACDRFLRLCAVSD